MTSHRKNSRHKIAVLTAVFPRLTNIEMLQYRPKRTAKFAVSLFILHTIAIYRAQDASSLWVPFKRSVDCRFQHSASMCTLSYTQLILETFSQAKLFAQYPKECVYSRSVYYYTRLILHKKAVIPPPPNFFWWRWRRGYGAHNFCKFETMRPSKLFLDFRKHIFQF